MASIRKREWVSGGTKRTAWVVDYFDQHGKRRLKTFATAKEARAWNVDAQHQVKQGTHTADSTSITLGEAADKWLATIEAKGRERSTVDQYRGHVVHHIKPRIGDVKLSKLSTPKVEEFAEDLLKTVSRPTAKKVMTSLKSILSDAQRRGLVAQNVARPTKIEAPSRGRKRVEIPTKTEINAMLDKADGRWRPFLVTAVFTGLRASELRGLRWEDVDFDGRMLHVRQRADAWGKIGSPKSEAGTRDIPLPPMVLNALREWKLACPKGDLGLVFPNGDGNPENHANIVNRFFAPLQVACGIADGTGKKDEEGNPIMRARHGLHALRHFYASWLIDQGFQPKRVQSLLGHASIVMTMDRYGHLFPNPDDDHAKLAAGELALVGA